MGWTEFLHRSLEWIEQSGWVGAVGFIVLYTLTCVFFLPGSVLTVGAGAVGSKTNQRYELEILE